MTLGQSCTKMKPWLHQITMTMVLTGIFRAKLAYQPLLVVWWAIAKADNLLLPKIIVLNQIYLINTLVDNLISSVFKLSKYLQSMILLSLVIQSVTIQSDSISVIKNQSVIPANQCIG